MSSSMCVWGQGRAAIWRMEVKVKVEPPLKIGIPLKFQALKIGIPLKFEALKIGIELKELKGGNGVRVLRVGASMLDSCSDNDNFAKRIEQAWFISQQPTPIACSSCNTNGHIECKWCAGTGFFIIGDNMLCQVPSRNTTCVICGGEGSTQCTDCQGTGFRAKWLGKPQVNEE